MPRELYELMGLAREEYTRIVEALGRAPNDVELGMLGVMWSEHCSYKNSRPVLRLFPTQGKHVLQGPGENAGIVDVGDGMAVAFKIESHNHPSAIEPYQGAATGIGGIVRDILAMGARPIALLDSLRFGNPADKRVRYLFAGVVSGISGYGNCIGVPTVGGEVYFADAYADNPLVNVMCLGLLEDRGRLTRGAARGPGNPVMLLGARTGRDGIHGCTFASEELSAESARRRPAVQVGDPFTKKLLIEACLELVSTGMVVGLQDLGAAGLTSACAETAHRGGCGVDIDVSLVPRREEGMTPYEVMLSESQERMLVIVPAGREEEVRRIMARWDLAAVTVGRVTADGVMRVRDGSRVVAELPVELLTEGFLTYTREGREPGESRAARLFDPGSQSEPADYGECLKKVLGSPTVASKEWVYRQYDYMVRTNTVVYPGADAAVLRLKGTRKAIAVSLDGNGLYCFVDPYRGGAIAVAEAARNLACVGAQPLAITDCLNFGNPQKPEVYWQFCRVVEGMSEACRVLGIPVVSGNVSFYNETDGRAVYPTPVVGMVGLLPDASARCTPWFKQEGDVLALLGQAAPELGCSEYLRVVHGVEGGQAPALDLAAEKRLHAACLEAIRRGIVRSAHDCAEGGLAVALAEGCLGANPGARGARVRVSGEGRPDALLFGEGQGRIVVSLPATGLARLEELARAHDVPCAVLGEVVEGVFEVSVAGRGELIRVPTEELARVWRDCLPQLMGS